MMGSGVRESEPRVLLVARPLTRYGCRMPPEEFVAETRRRKFFPQRGEKRDSLLLDFLGMR